MKQIKKQTWVKTVLMGFLLFNFCSCGADFYASNYDFETTAIYTAPKSGATAMVLTKGYVPNGADLGDENQCLVVARITFNQKPVNVIKISSNGRRVFFALVNEANVPISDSSNYFSVLLNCSRQSGAKEIDTAELNEFSHAILGTGYGPKGTVLKGQSKTIIVDTVRYFIKDR
jgi:hypothetical protein